MNRADVEPEVEIVAERSRGHHLGEVAVGGGDDADVDARRLGRPDAPDLVLLEDAEQLDLGGQRQVADLVEEDRAAVGRLEEPLVVAIGAGEGTADVAEELGLDQRRRERGAVADDERTAAARRQPVDGARDELLAGAALAGDERGRGVGRQAADEAEELEHDRRLADHAFEGRRRERTGRGLRRGPRQLAERKAAGGDAPGTHAVCIRRIGHAHRLERTGAVGQGGEGQFAREHLVLRLRDGVGGPVRSHRCAIRDARVVPRDTAGTGLGPG